MVAGVGRGRARRGRVGQPQVDRDVRGKRFVGVHDDGKEREGCRRHRNAVAGRGPEGRSRGGRGRGHRHDRVVLGGRDGNVPLDVEAEVLAADGDEQLGVDGCGRAWIAPLGEYRWWSGLGRFVSVGDDLASRIFAVCGQEPLHHVNVVLFGA